MECVGAGLGDHIHRAASAVPVGGVGLERFHFHFFDRVHRRAESQPVADACVRCAVQQDFVAPVWRAADRESRRSPVVEGPIESWIVVRDHAEGKLREHQRRAPVHGHVLDLPLVDHLPGGRGGGREQRALGRDGHGVRDLSDLQLDVERQALVRRYTEPLPHEALESRDLGAHGVGARRQKRQRELAVAARYRLRLRARLDLGCADFGCGDGGGLRIGDTPRDRASELLRERDRGGQCGDCKKEGNAMCHVPAHSVCGHSIAFQRIYSTCTAWIFGIITWINARTTK